MIKVNDKMKYRLSIGLLILMLLFSMSGCSALQQEQTQTVQPQSTEPAAGQETSGKLEITDLKGRVTTLDKLPERIVSLSPANTEILFELGAGDKVVGVTSYCDFPEQVKAVEKVGTFEGPNMELIKKAQPDVVLAGGYIQEDLIKNLEALNIPVISTEAMDFGSIFDSVKLIGKITGTEEKADALVNRMKESIAAISEKTKDKAKKKVFYLVWMDPMTTAGSGTFINDVILAAGGVNAAAKVDGWAKYSAEELMLDNPDILVAAFHSTDDGITKDNIAKNPIYSKLDCVKKGHIYVMSDDNIISRPGPRIVKAIEEMAAAFYGEL